MLPTVHSREDVEKLIAGIKAWRPLADTVCVATGPGQAEMFAELRRRVPEMQLIPGLVTSSWIARARFDSPVPWERLAREIALVARVCGQKRVLLDNETALAPFLKGNAELDERRLRTALSLLPKDIQIIWYPAMYWVVPQQRQKSEWLCRIVAEELDCRLVDASFGDRTWSAAGPTETRQKLEAFSRNPTLPIVWFGRWPGSNCPYWEYDQVGEVLDLLAGRDECLVYPGMARFQEAAERLGPLVRQHCGRE